MNQLENKACRPALILASASPRRKKLLKDTGITFSIKPTDVDESILSLFTPEGFTKGVVSVVDRSPIEFVEAIAKRKLVKALQQENDIVWVLAADTIVWQKMAENRWIILGKPHSQMDAEKMLRQLQDTMHFVTTGYAFGKGKKLSVFHETTKVYLRKLTENEIMSHVHSKEPYDKAGGYGVQANAAKFVDRIEGSYTNVVGLPVGQVLRAFDLLCKCSS